MKKIFCTILLVLMMSINNLQVTHAESIPNINAIFSKNFNFVFIQSDSFFNFSNKITVKIGDKEFSRSELDGIDLKIVVGFYDEGTPYSIYYQQYADAEKILLFESKVGGDYQNSIKFPKEVSDRNNKIEVSMPNIDASFYNGVFQIYALYNGEKYYSSGELYGNSDILEEKNTIEIVDNEGRNLLEGGKKIVIYFENYQQKSIELGSIVVIDNTPPTSADFNFNEITIRDAYIKGTTEEKGATINIYIDKNKYSSKEKNGKFTVGIPPQKENQKYFIEIVDKNGNKSKKFDYTVEGISDNALYYNDVSYTTTIIKGTIKTFRAGDYIKVKIGNKSYIYKLNSSKKFSIKIPKQKANTIIYIGNYDIKGNLLDSGETRVYTTNDIKIGMTKAQVLATKWGKPLAVKKTTTAFGTSEVWWYFKSGDVFLYFNNGILTKIEN